MVSWIIFAIVLFLIAAVLLVIEVFVPSFGMIGLCALSALAGGIYIFFTYSTALGWIGVAVAVVLVPTVLIIAYQTVSKTRFGKNLMLAPPGGKAGEGVPDAPQLRELMGREGVVVTPLRPVGTCEFGEVRLECVAESGFVGNGTKVRVINVDGTQVTVRTI